MQEGRPGEGVATSHEEPQSADSSSPQETELSKESRLARSIIDNVISGIANIRRVLDYYDTTPQRETYSRLGELDAIIGDLADKATMTGGIKSRTILSLLDIDSLSNLVEISIQFRRVSSVKALQDLYDQTDIIFSTLLEALERLDLDLDKAKLISDESRRKITDTVGRLRLRAALRRTEAAAAVAENSARYAQEASGEAGREGLAAHFEAYAQRERLVADLLRFSVIGLACTVTVLAAWLLLIAGSKMTWIELIRKAVLSIPLAALAAYLARESGKHRTKADWAASIAVQLRTVNAFTEPLADALKEDIRGSFGRMIFGTPLGSSPSSTTGSDSAEGSTNGKIEDLIIDVIKKLATDSAKK